MTIPWNIQDSNPDGIVFKYLRSTDVSHIKVGDSMPGNYNGYSYYVSSIVETCQITYVHMEKVA
jgi:hypothetical protein